MSIPSIRGFCIQPPVVVRPADAVVYSLPATVRLASENFLEDVEQADVVPPAPALPAHPPPPCVPIHDPSVGADGAIDVDSNYSMGGHLVLTEPASPQDADRAVRPAALPQNGNRPPAAACESTVTTTRQAPPFPNANPGATATAPPRAYDVTDPQIFWLNNRPYLLQASVGKGGFGEVHRVEMMLPLGMAVQRKPKTGAFVLDADGRVCVHLTKQERPYAGIAVPADRSSPSGTMECQREGDVPVAADEGVAKALQLSEAAPDSMKFFSHKETVVEGADGKGADGTFWGIHRGDIESSGLGRFRITI